jgi:hypothetical protein
MALPPPPNVNIPVLGPDGLFVLPWRRWFQNINTVVGGTGPPGADGKDGGPGPPGPAGSGGALALLSLAQLGSGAGTVTSVALAAPAEFVVSGSPITSQGTLTLTKANENANLVWAGPTTGAAAQPTFRSLVGADLPNPSATTLGGIESLAAVTSKWINQISTSGVPSATQPAATDLSDTVTRTTFTPTITFATPGNLTVSYTTQTGAYVKVGPMVLFWMSLAFTPTYTTASGPINISVPPVAPTDAQWVWDVRSLGTVTWPSGVTAIQMRVSGGPVLTLFGIGSGGTNPSFGTTQFISGTAYTLQFSGYYF